jgi:hypothetical protein
MVATRPATLSAETAPFRDPNSAMIAIKPIATDVVPHALLNVAITQLNAPNSATMETH